MKGRSSPCFLLLTPLFLTQWLPAFNKRKAGCYHQERKARVRGKARPLESCSVTGLQWHGDDIALFLSLDLQSIMIPTFSISPLYPQQRPAFHFGSLPHTASAASLPVVILEKTWASSSGGAHCFLTANNWCG